MSRSGQTASTTNKRVYLFGGGKADGTAQMKELLGGKGANLAEMASLGLPVPPGFTITTEVCTAYNANGRKLPDDLEQEVEAALAHVGKTVGATFGDAQLAAAGLGALGRARVHARHDGHHPQPRPQRRDRQRPGRQVGQRAVRLRQLPPLHPDVCQRGAGRRPRRVRGHPREPQEPGRAHARHRARRRRLAANHRRLQGGGGAGDGQAVPARHLRAALGRHRRRVRLLAQRPRQDLSPPARHSRQLGHGGQRAGHGVRQPGRRLGHRRRLHAQPLHRRARGLRRVPDQRAGRGRRRGHPHAAGPVRGRTQGGRRKGPIPRDGDARHLPRARPGVRVAREALPRHAGHRVHHPGRQALDAADALRQAHHEGGAQGRRRPRRRRADHARGGRAAHRRGRPRPAPAPHHRPGGGKAIDRGDRLAGLAGRRLRRDRVRRRRGRGPEGPRPRGDPGAHRDEPGGHPRHARRGRHPHHARRHDQPRRGGRPRHGAAVRVRRRRAAHRRQGRHHDGRRRRPSARATSSPSTAPRARCSRAA